MSIVPNDDEPQNWRELAEACLADMERYAGDETSARMMVSYKGYRERFELLARAPGLERSESNGATEGSHTPSGIRVKELEWEEIAPGIHRAACLSHEYQVDEDEAGWMCALEVGADIIELEDSLAIVEEAKAACQSDFQRRITECLEGEAWDFADFLARKNHWSAETFGPVEHRGPLGPLDHLRKEIEEAEAATDDVSEFADLIFLATDAAFRAGHSPADIIDGLEAKLSVNQDRIWPDWRRAPADKAIEHDRSDDVHSMDATGWRDISTAPKDGTVFIAWETDPRESHGLGAGVYQCAWRKDDWRGPEGEQRRPTHWHPLPPPPGEEVSREDLRKLVSFLAVRVERLHEERDTLQARCDKLEAAARVLLLWSRGAPEGSCLEDAFKDFRSVVDGGE